MKKSLLSFLLFYSVMLFADEPVLIFTYVYNRPDFIELHVRTFKAFFKEPYEYIVFNDSPNAAMSGQIEQMCQKLGVRCFRVPNHAPNRQTPSYRHMDGIKYSLERFGFDHDGTVIMVDADMFLVKPFSVKEYMHGYNFIGGYQDREGNGKKVIYTAPCLVFMDMAQLPNKRTINFDGDYVEGLACDVGGQTYHYFKNNSEIRLKLFIAYSKDYLVNVTTPLSEYGYDENSIDLIMNNKREYAFQYHADGNFLHFYAGGSNWPNYSASFVQEKTNLVNQYIDRQIEYYSMIGKK